MASKKPSGLGRGLGALLGDDAVKAESSGSLYLPISQVESCSSQPRKHFDPESLQELADSITEHGIIQPLTVRRLASGYYQIIAGERAGAPLGWQVSPRCLSSSWRRMTARRLSWP